MQSMSGNVEDDDKLGSVSGIFHIRHFQFCENNPGIFTDVFRILSTEGKHAPSTSRFADRPKQQAANWFPAATSADSAWSRPLAASSLRTTYAQAPPA